MIQIGNMNKVFHLKSGDVTALDNVTLNIEDGMIYGVIGYSGAGKSTLVRCLNLLETPDDGTLSVGDSGVITLRGGKAYDAQGRKLTERKLGAMRRGIGMIFQHFNLLDRSTVFENIAYPLRYTGMKKADMEARVFELLDLVDLRDKADVYPSQLSGGQKQRAAIARALANDPDILLCDEATSALDPQTTKSILKLLERLNRELGITLVVITHEMAVVKEICNRVAVMDHGRVVEEGEVFSVFASPKEELTRSFIKTTSNLQKIEELIAAKSPVVALKPGERIVRLSYVERNASEPLISTMTKKYGVILNIIFADIEIVQNAPIGGTVGILSGPQDKMDEALEDLRSKNVGVEVILDAGDSESVSA